MGSIFRCSKTSSGKYKTTTTKHSNLSKQWGCSIWLKWESENPTGSHKDRESAQIIETCIRHNFPGVGCASTGNFAVSLAYHAQKYSIPCDIWLPRSYPSESVALQLKDLSATLHYVDGNLSNAYAISTRELKRRSFMNANPGHCAEKLMAHENLAEEIFYQLPEVTRVICPINNGSLFLGLAKGLQKRNIQLIGVYTYSKYASSICGFLCAEGKEAISHCVNIQGTKLFEVSDNHLLYGIQELLGVQKNTEVSSASVIGILPQLNLNPHDVICCLITSSGKNKPMEVYDFCSSFQGKDFQFHKEVD